jgi:DNA polymerase (family 10)
MPLRNADIARVLDEIADLLELGQENPFRIRAYRNAAREIDTLSLDIAGVVASGQPLPKIYGVGEDLAAKIAEIVQSGRCAFLDELRQRYPSGITTLLALPGLGPKRLRVLYEKLGVGSLADLQRAATEGRIRALAGFGEKTEQKIREAIEARLGTTAGQFKLAFARDYAERYLRYLEAEGAKAVIAGSYRRRKETLNDLDFLMASREAQKAIERFVRYGEVKEVLAQGSTKASIVLVCGLQADLRLVPPESFGAALQYFTGSKEHNVAVRRLALKRGLKINEYGVFRGDERIAGDTEESVYAALGLRPPPPEEREGEILQPL